jgi:hypothetical protein
MTNGEDDDTDRGEEEIFKTGHQSSAPKLLVAAKTQIPAGNI